MPHSPRIAIVRSRYNPFGGAERFVERALNALSAQALDVSLITRQWPRDAQSPFKVRLCAPFHIGRLWRDWAFCRSVQKLMRSEAYDLVQSHERIPSCDLFRAGDGVHATWLAQRARSLGFFARIAQDLSPWHRYTLAAEARMFRHPSLRAVICNSTMVAQDIAQRFPSTAGKLHVVHNGVDLQRFSPHLRAEHRLSLRQKLGIGDDVPVLIYVGSGFARKGVPALLEALARPELAGAQLWVIGKDKLQARLERRAKKLGVAHRVRFLGPQKDVAPFLGAADVFALPTLYDPMPNAALEALACGLPVLSSDSSGAAELITSEACGRVVDALDIAAIAQAGQQLLALIAAQQEVVAQACRASVAALSSEDMAERQLHLYRKLLAPQCSEQIFPAQTAHKPGTQTFSNY